MILEDQGERGIHSTPSDRKQNRHPFRVPEFVLQARLGEGSFYCLCLIRLLILTRFIPEREFDSVPEAEFVVDYAEVVLDNVFGCAEGICNFPVLTAFGDELDDGMFSGIGSAGIDCFSDHSCLL